ncbi:MAG: hypothetical protein WC481_01840 [Candidatus Omnitrophota bacterium]
MKKCVITLAILFLAPQAFSAMIMPPKACIVLAIGEARTEGATPANTVYPTEIDFKSIVRHDRLLTKAKVFDLFRSIDPEKIRWSNYQKRDTLIEMVAPDRILFAFEEIGGGKDTIPYGYKLIGIRILQRSIPDEIYLDGDWMLHVYLHDRGTKSEGAFGRLYYKERLVPPGKVGQEENTPFGVLKYYGEGSNVRWAPSGWLFKDKGKIPRTY